jgi:hypothetical protein
MTRFEKCGAFVREKVCLENSLRQTFSRINIPTFLKPSHSSHLPAYEDGRVFSETSAYKIQTPGNYPEESIQRHVCYKSAHYYCATVTTNEITNTYWSKNYSDIRINDSEFRGSRVVTCRQTNMMKLRAGTHYPHVT